MNNQLLRQIIAITTVLIALALLGWAGYEFIYKGSVTISQPGDGLTVSIADSKNTIVASGSANSYKLTPGSYTVIAKNNTAGVSAAINVSPLGTTTITMPSEPALAVTQLAKVPMYGAYSSGGTILGLNPQDSRMQRIDNQGNASPVLTLDLLADKQGNAEAELPERIINYQPYGNDQALVASNGLLFAVSKKQVKEISIADIPVDHTDPLTPQYIIATKPGSDAFVVAYKQDIYWYQDTSAAPKKIYIAPKKFDSLVYGGNTIGLYYANMPTSTQDLRSTFKDYQYDLLLIDTANNNSQQTVSGLLNNVTLSPDGALATVQPRDGQPYLYNLADKKSAGNIDAPLIVGPQWTSNTTYVYGKSTTIWQYNTQNKQSVLLGEVQYPVTSVRKEGANNSYIVSTYGGDGQAVVYRLGGDTATATKLQSIGSSLPYKTANYTITYSNVSGPTILIETFAPLNSASHLQQYQQETLQYRQQALDYLRSNNIDTTGFTITYNPGDPL